MGKIIVLYGLPAAGKGTQAELLCNKYGFYKFGMGERLRAEIAADTDLGRKIKTTVESGLLVSDDLIKGVLRNIKQPAQETGIVFDGFPRMVPQAELLDGILAEAGLGVDYFFLLKVSPEEAEKRIRLRADIDHRGDDMDEKVVSSRMDVFRQESTALIAHYREKGKLIEINGELSIPEVLTEIEKHLN